MDQKATESPQVQQLYKKGDVLWVKYRNKDWPAKVTAYYPKTKKISHIWFPLNRKSINAVFKADESKVRPFTDETPLPPDADANLEESYNQALRILHGATEEEIVQEHDRYLEEFAAVKQKSTPIQQKLTPKSKKSLASMDVLKKTTTPRGTPKKVSGKSTASSSAATAASSDFEELPVPSKFEPGDTIIVDTKIGMWPGIFHSYVEDNQTQIRYTLFPRTQPVELLTGPLSSLLHFPLDQIDAAMMDFNGSDVLMHALLDARNYLDVLSKQPHTSGNKQQRQLIQKAPGTEKNVSDTKMNRIKSNMASPKENLYKNKSLSASSEIVEKPAKTKASAQARLSQKRSLTTSTSGSSQREPVYRQKETHSPLVKKGKQNDDRNFNEATREERTQTDKSNIVHAVSDSKSDSSSTSPQKQMPMLLNNGRIPKAALQNQNEEGEQHEDEEEEPMIIRAPETPEKQFFDANKDNASEDDVEHVMETPEHNQSQEVFMVGEHIANETPDDKSRHHGTIFEFTMSEEAHGHMRYYWDEVGEEQFKKLENAEFYHLDFRTYGLLTFEETEKLVSEVQKWIKLNYKIPILTQLKELFYIAKYVLPELCVYAISKQQGISMEAAKQIYEEKRTMNNSSQNANDAGGSASPPVAATNSKLDTLVMAANLMADKKNGQNGSGEGRSPS